MSLPGRISVAGVGGVAIVVMLATTCAFLLLAPRPATAKTTESPKRIAGTEQVHVDLVLIDLVVRDRKDQPVTGLTRGDFDLIIDGVAVSPADIESFEEVCGAQEPPAQAAQAGIAPLPLPPGGQTEPPPAGARHIVIYFDFTHMTTGAAHLALRGAKDYLARHLAPEDRVMILADNNGLRLIQDFTSDGRALIARIDALLADKGIVATDVMGEDRYIIDVKEAPCDPPDCGPRRALSAAYAGQEENRGRRTLESLSSLMPALAGLKGRKALVLFTEALRMEPGAQYYALTETTARDDGYLLERELLRLASEANAAGVSFYTVHAGGMTADFEPVMTAPFVGPKQAGVDSAHDLQITLATETGGKALRNSNDVGAILGTAEGDLSCYYLLGYRYQGRGDNKRHSILVKLKPSSKQGARPSGLTVRCRPYYVDQRADDRRDRLVSAALRAPPLFHDLPVSLEAFALAPARSGGSTNVGRRVLIKSTVPLASLPLLPSGDLWVEGRLALRGEVMDKDAKQVCAFDHEMPLRIPREEVSSARLVYETGCVLEPGVYTLSMTAMDPVTLEIGARKASLVVLKPDTSDGAYLSEFYLWTRDPGTLLVTSGLGSIGVRDSVMTSGLLPRPERRMDGRQDAALSFTLCLPRGGGPQAGSPLRVTRTLLGQGDAKVAEFQDLVIGEDPDPDTGCYQVSTTIPAGTLGDGVYSFTVGVSGATLKRPVSRQVALAVD